MLRQMEKNIKQVTTIIGEIDVSQPKVIMTVANNVYRVAPEKRNSRFF